MRRVIKTLLFSTVAVLALVLTVPSSSNADNVKPVRHGDLYQPHYVLPRYGDWYPYAGRYYYYGPGVQVYRYPHRYYDYYYYHPHGGVDVGPFRFELWH